MALTLSIENETQLPDGGPLSIRVAGRRGIDIGRDQHLDWTLPDQDRHVSSTHCEVRYRDGGYWLTDVSLNGTFLNGSDRRLSEPYRLRDGDRLEIGRYQIIVAVDMSDLPAMVAPPAPQSAPAVPAFTADVWGDSSEVPAAPPAAMRPAGNTPPSADFLDWAADLPGTTDAAFVNGQSGWSVWEGPEQPATPAPSRQAVPPRPPAARAPEAFASPGAAAALPDGAGLAGPQPPPSEREGPQTGWGRSLRSAPEPSAGAPAPAVEPQSPSTAGASAADAPSSGLSGEDVRRRLARGAGIPESLIADTDAGELVEELGRLLRIVAENLKQMLSARTESRVMMRTANHTMISASDNNPLKFSPTAEDALCIMLGRRSNSYMDAGRALTDSFDDLKRHQLLIVAAMQYALQRLSDDLEPEAIEKSAGAEKSGGLLSSRSAKLWERYVAKWKSIRSAHDNGLQDVFLAYCSEFFQRQPRNGR